MSKPDFPFEFGSTNMSVAAVSDVAFMSAKKRSEHSLYQKVGKPSFDILITLLFLPIILPIVLIFALLIALDGSSPFYVQKRIGRDGRIFGMWKLRTMVPDAEAKLDVYLATSDEVRTEWEVKQKLHDDPRITAIGQFLRRTSLDEFPQFFNVLRGDMSLVGPRPMMAGQEHLYPGQSYYALRPGLTGLWQVSDRNQSSFADRARFDDSYFNQVSVFTDMRLMVSTINVVFRGTGC